MPTRSQAPTLSSAATPAALGPAAPSTARAAYFDQKRFYLVRRGVVLHGDGVVVPRLTHADALELVFWWSHHAPAPAAGVGDLAAIDADLDGWARGALAARGLASGPVAAGAGGQPFPDAPQLWHCIRAIATAMDRRNVAAPRWASLQADVATLGSDLGRAGERVRTQAKDLDADVRRAQARARAHAGGATQTIGTLSDALAGGVAKVSGAAGRGAGEGAVKGALSAAAVPAAVGGAALVSGLVLWRFLRSGGTDDGESATGRRKGGRR